MKIINFKHVTLEKKNKVVDFIKKHNFPIIWDKTLTTLYVSNECAGLFWELQTWGFIKFYISIPTYSCFELHSCTFDRCLEYIKLGNSPIKSENIFAEKFESGEEIKIYCDQTDEVIYATTISYKDCSEKK